MTNELLKESTTAQKYIFQIFPIIRNILRQTSNLFLIEEEALYFILLYACVPLCRRVNC